MDSLSLTAKPRNLYLAPSFTVLNDKYAVVLTRDDLFGSNRDRIKRANFLYFSAKGLIDTEQDQEKAYVLYFRFIRMVSILQKEAKKSPGLSKVETKYRLL